MRHRALGGDHVGASAATTPSGPIDRAERGPAAPVRRRLPRHRAIGEALTHRREQLVGRHRPRPATSHTGTSAQYPTEAAARDVVASTRRGRRPTPRRGPDRWRSRPQRPHAPARSRRRHRRVADGGRTTIPSSSESTARHGCRPGAGALRRRDRASRRRTRRGVGQRVEQVVGRADLLELERRPCAARNGSATSATTSRATTADPRSDGARRCDGRRRRVPRDRTAARDGAGRLADEHPLVASRTRAT